MHLTLTVKQVMARRCTNKGWGEEVDALVAASRPVAPSRLVRSDLVPPSVIGRQNVPSPDVPDWNQSLAGTSPVKMAPPVEISGRVTLLYDERRLSLVPQTHGCPREMSYTRVWKWGFSEADKHGALRSRLSPGALNSRRRFHKESRIFYTAISHRLIGVTCSMQADFLTLRLVFRERATA